MDLEMPVMGGIKAIEKIMAERATPILVLSNAASAKNAVEAMSRGALEVIAKTPETLTADLGKRLKLLAKIPVIRHIRVNHNKAVQPQRKTPERTEDIVSPKAIFAIASSTGGPQALGTILSQLPADFPCPILIAQHIADGFSEGMAEWLDTQCALRVKVAEHHDPIQSGTVLIAPPETHMEASANGQVNFFPRRENDIYRPSCDALLKSVADTHGRTAVGIILTGMGRDGANGMFHIKDKGGVTLAQNEASSVVFGMNKVAVESGCVDTILDLHQIAEEMQWLAVTRR
jgi:two-component system chemotaxis response regulator CheB